MCYSKALACLFFAPSTASLVGMSAPALLISVKSPAEVNSWFAAFAFLFGTAPTGRRAEYDREEERKESRDIVRDGTCFQASSQATEWNERERGCEKKEKCLVGRREANRKTNKGEKLSVFSGSQKKKAAHQRIEKCQLASKCERTLRENERATEREKESAPATQKHRVDFVSFLCSCLTPFPSFFLSSDHV